MQQAIPYRIYESSPIKGVINQSLSITKNLKDSSSEVSLNRVKEMVEENAVVVFGRRGCCMCCVVTQLLLLLGVNLAICEVDAEDENGVLDDLEKIGGGDEKGRRPQMPCVYIGGLLFGDLERLIAAHISGELLPVLKHAGALWL
ncbi:hypothetical protein ACHQM5_003336 [Ranunculus cassubicifolius]